MRNSARICSLVCQLSGLLATASPAPTAYAAGTSNENATPLDAASPTDLPSAESPDLEEAGRCLVLVQTLNFDAYSFLSLGVTAGCFVISGFLLEASASRGYAPYMMGLASADAIGTRALLHTFGPVHIGLGLDYEDLRANSRYDVVDLATDTTSRQFFDHRQITGDAFISSVFQGDLLTWQIDWAGVKMVFARISDLGPPIHMHFVPPETRAYFLRLAVGHSF